MGHDMERVTNTNKFKQTRLHQNFTNLHVTMLPSLTFAQQYALAERKVTDTALGRLEPNLLPRGGALQREDAVIVVAYFTILQLCGY